MALKTYTKNVGTGFTDVVPAIPSGRIARVIYAQAANIAVDTSSNPIASAFSVNWVQAGTTPRTVALSSDIPLDARSAYGLIRGKPVLQTGDSLQASMAVGPVWVTITVDEISADTNLKSGGDNFTGTVFKDIGISVSTGRVARFAHCLIANKTNNIVNASLDHIDISRAVGDQEVPQVRNVQVMPHAVLQPLSGELTLEAGDTMKWNAGVAGAADISYTVIESAA